VVSTSQQENVRIVVNRLAAANLVYNPKLANKNESVTCPPYYMEVEILGVRVPVCLNMTSFYDDLGILVESSGTMVTRSVEILPSGAARLGEPLVLGYNMASSRIPRADYNLSYLCLISASVSVLAMISVVASRGAVFYTREDLLGQYL
jgi:hypothetical protein